MAIYKSNTPTKDGRRYFFRIKYKDIFGISHDYSSPKYLTKKEAEHEEALYRINISHQETQTSNITIKQAFIEFLEDLKNKTKKSNIEKTKSMFKTFQPIENIKINNFNLATYKKFYSYLLSLHHSAAHTNKLLGLLKRIISYANKYYNTNDSIIKFIEPIRDKTLKKEMEFYTYDDYNTFRNVITDFNWLTWFDTLYYLGLRCGECQALQFKDIDFNKNTLTINKTLTTKIKGEKWTISTPKTSGSIRILPIPKKLLEQYKTMQINASKFTDYSNEWFLFGNSIPFKENTIQLRKNKYCDLAGLKRIRIHDFRHSCASFLINYCHASISLVSKYLGHSSISMTLNTYTHMYKSELEDITKIIDNL